MALDAGAVPYVSAHRSRARPRSTAGPARVGVVVTN